MKFDVMRHVIGLCLSDFQSRARLLIIHFFFRPQTPPHPHPLTLPSQSHWHRIASPHLIPSIRSQSLLKRLSVCCVRIDYRARSLTFSVFPSRVVTLLLSGFRPRHITSMTLYAAGLLHTCALACIVRTYFIMCH